MKSSGTSEFWQRYRALPKPIRESARQTYRLWSDNPRAPKLRFKKVRDAYSIRIGATGHRAIAVDVPDGFLWIWIGPHDAYERLLKE
jgi:hypothetical protein